MEFKQFIGVFIGIFMVIIGMFFSKKHSNYGSNVGINTPHARKSKENWDFAQKNAPQILMKYGLINIILNIVLLIYNDWSTNLTNVLFVLEVIISFISLILVVVNIENSIKKFENKNL